MMKQDAEYMMQEAEQASEELEEERSKFEKEKKLMSNLSAANGDVLTLNVSGTKMQVTRSLLTKVMGSKLAARFSG